MVLTSKKITVKLLLRRLKVIKQFWTAFIGYYHIKLLRFSNINPITPDVHQMIKYTLKILQQMLQDF